jgi:hypothetical protein
MSDDPKAGRFTPRFWVALAVLFLAALFLPGCTNQRCERALSLTDSEHDVNLVLVANPGCAQLVTDSLMGPRRAALDTAR